MFSRGSRTTGRHARTDRSRRDQRGRAESRTQRSLADELGVTDQSADHPADQPAGEPTPAPPAEPAGGPYDITEAPAGVNRLDLGSLRIPSVRGVEVRVQANQQGLVQQVYLVHGDSALQLGAFAAPRTEPIWDEVRAEIRTSLFDDGVAAEEVEGPYGTELRARVRTQEGLKDLRFVGVSGPRWLVRAVYQGPAAVDPAQAGPLAECLRGLVVDRGDEAKPTREPLPLRLSDQLAAQLPAGSAGSAGSAGGASASAVPGAVGRAAVTPGGAASGGAPRRKPSPRPRREAPGPERSLG